VENGLLKRLTIISAHDRTPHVELMKKETYITL